MEGGILEVLLVNAEGIRLKKLFGKPAYYVLIQCGTEVRRSKTTKVYRHEAFWNQKFEFEFPFSKWKKLTHLEIIIMDEESFKGAGFVGRAIIYLGGIIAEGSDRGRIELHPSPYNVVIEDTSYKGQIKIGLKFQVTTEALKEIKKETIQVAETRQRFWRSLFRILKLSWWRVFFLNNEY